MKSILPIQAYTSSSSSQVHSTINGYKTQSFTKPKTPDTVSNSDRIVSNAIVTYNNKGSVKTNTALSIHLPNNIYEYVDESILDIMHQQIQNMNFENLLSIACDAKNILEADEVIKWAITSKQPIENMHRLIIGLCENYAPNWLNKSSYLKEYFNLQVKKEGIATYTIKTYDPNNFYSIPYRRKDVEISQHLLAANRLVAKLGIITIANHNKNLGIMNQCFHYINDNIEKDLEIIKKDSNLYNSATLDFTSVINFMQPQYRVQFISKYKDHLSSNLIVSTYASNLLKDSTNYSECLTLLELAMSKATSESNAQELGLCQYEAANVLGKMDRSVEAFNYIELAYKNLPGEEEVLQQYYYLGLSIGEYSKVYKVVDSLENEYLKTIYKTTLGFEPPNYSALLSIPNNKVSGIDKSHLLAARFFAKYQMFKKQNITTTSDAFKNDLLNNITNGMSKRGALSLAISLDFPEVAKSLMNEYTAEQIQNDKDLRKCNACINGTIKGFTAELQSYNIESVEKAELYNITAQSLLADNQTKEAEVPLNEALKITPNDTDLLETAILTAALNKDDKKLAQYSEDLEKISLDSVSAIKSIFGKDENDQHDNKILKGEELDPKKIHRFFQLMKAKNLAKLSSVVNFSEWNVDNLKINKNETTYLGKFRGIDCYGYIDPKLKIGESYDILLQAMKKGFVGRDEGQNGIKYIPGKGWELKSKMDKRPFTSTMYINDNNEGLIYFNDITDHNKKGYNKGKIEFRYFN